MAREKYVEIQFLQRFFGKSGSAACGKGHNFNARAAFDHDLIVIAREDRLFVEFDDNRFAGEAEGFEKPVQRQRGIEFVGISVKGDLHRRGLHWESCSGKGQFAQSEKSSRQKS